MYVVRQITEPHCPLVAQFVKVSLQDIMSQVKGLHVVHIPFQEI